MISPPVAVGETALPAAGEDWHGVAHPPFNCRLTFPAGEPGVGLAAA
jgi:hypothetical protein